MKKIRNVIVLNLGSTSFKFKLFDFGAGEKVLATGEFENIGSPIGAYSVTAGGKTVKGEATCKVHGDAFAICLDALKDAGAHATFFYIGAHIARNEETRKEVEEAWKASFEVANHSYDSNGLNGADADTVKEKIDKTDELLSEITGYKNFLFRAPNVAYSATMYAVIEKPFIDVSIWSNDYQTSVEKDAIVKNVTEKLADGGIINMHSVHEKTAQAVPEILAYCKENGYQVVSVSELFAIKGKKLMTGVKYSDAN